MVLALKRLPSLPASCPSAHWHRARTQRELGGPRRHRLQGSTCKGAPSPTASPSGRAGVGTQDPQTPPKQPASSRVCPWALLPGPRPPWGLVPTPITGRLWPQSSALHRPACWAPHVCAGLHAGHHLACPELTPQTGLAPPLPLKPIEQDPKLWLICPRTQRVRG